ncbi:Ankyrin_repeat protein 2 [Hexamita inflata]|uniref:Ankyrin repeat protein 2 n=1 Tax=Hexamita inflata TaxID=28002 RepID=A0AA86TWT3_9EUKA|nr:Ankyrin repeat protein 2 [Hexamita inflata]
MEASSDFSLQECSDVIVKFQNECMLDICQFIHENNLQQIFTEIDDNSVNTKDIIMYAVMQNKTQITTWLYERYGFVVENSKKTPLMIAAQNNNVELVKLFMSQAKSRDAAGMTALMHAVVHDSLDCIKLLKQTEKEIKDNSGWNAMQYADGFRSDEAIAALL